MVHVPSIDPTIQKYLALYPHPTPGAGCVLVTVSGPLKRQCNPNVGPAPFLGAQTASENFVTFRADQKISSKDTAFVTYLRDPSVFSSPLTFNDTQQSFSSYRQAIVAEETHIFGPAWVNSLRAAVDRTNNLGGNSPNVVNPAAGDPSLGQLPGFYNSAITLTGTQVSVLPAGKNYAASVQDFWGQIFQIYDDVFFTHGTHGLKFGFSFLAYQTDAIVERRRHWLVFVPGNLFPIRYRQWRPDGHRGTAGVLRNQRGGEPGYSGRRTQLR
jgi:hypothetical protein